MQQPSFTRRGFLSHAAASVAVLTGCSALAAPANPPRIGFGYSLYGTRSLKVSEALKVCADIGYSGVELACMKDWPCDPAALNQANRKALRSELNDLALELPCLMENLVLVVPDAQHQSNLERLKNACQLGHDLCPDAPPVVETVLGGKPDEWPTVKDRMVEKLRDWDKVASAERTVVAVKAHAFGALHTPQDAKWLVQQINSPWIRLVFDYSHFQRQKLDLKESLSTMLAETVFVHIKDNITTAGKTEFALPGDAGDIDYAEFLKLLKEGGYRGSVVVEVSGQVFGKPGFDPIAAARRCYTNIQPAFVKAGLRIET
ncbi:MAG: sugar phosphate isomerase/epimerase [Planctomycetes bacterium]|nr:sugar phosphate isomerase/epimerase [Planctomycetota bacterium]